jgi:hypothetical protein
MATRERTAAGRERSQRLQGALSGLVLGVLSWVAARELGIRSIPPFGAIENMMLIAAAAGLCLGMTRARPLLWVAAGAAAIGVLVVAYVLPTADALRAWVREDPAPRVEVVVALSAGTHPDGTPDSEAELRLVRAYELLRMGHARRLLVTRLPPPFPSTLAAVREQMRRLGLPQPVEEVGPVANTHEEALAVARLARAHGWKRVIVVSDALHLRRAGAVFAHAGLEPFCVPGLKGNYDLEGLIGPTDRLAAFRDWLHEVIGLQIYRLRGWI